MEYLGNKLIEINITDSSLLANVPNTGSSTGLFSTVTDSLASTPATVIMLSCLFVALLTCLIAITLARLHHNKEKGSKFSKISKVLSKVFVCITPILAASAIIAAPLLNIIALNEGPISIDSAPIIINIDKAKTLSASKEVALTLNQDASSYVDIYAGLDTTFNNNLGANLLVSTNHISNSNSTTNLSTTEQLIYTTPGPIEAGIVEDFNVTVNITKDLPIGTYKGQIDYYGDFVQEEDDMATVVYWCEIEWVRDINDLDLDDDILIDNSDAESIFIGKSIKYNFGETFVLPWPAELGLNDCLSGEESYMAWNNLSRFNNDVITNYWSLDYGTFYNWSYDVSFGWPNDNDLATVLEEFPSQFLDSQPDPTVEDWFDSCWFLEDRAANYDYCYSPSTGYTEWIDFIYYPWRGQYENDWIDWGHNFRDETGTTPVFDGMKFEWFTMG